MDAPQVQCCRPLPFAGIWPPLSLCTERPDHPLAFFIVNVQSAEASQESAPPGPREPRTPPKKEKGKRPKVVQSTPHQIKTVDSVQDASGYISKDRHEKFIRREYTDKIHWDFDVETLILAVFRFGWQHIPPTPYRSAGASAKDAEHYSLLGGDIRAYRKSEERPSYKPLNLISNGLLTQLYGPDDEGRRSTRQADNDIDRHGQRLDDIKAHWALSGRDSRPRTYAGRLITHDCEAVNSYKSKDKPDGTYGIARGKPVWEWEVVPIEVGKDKEDIKKTLRDIFVRCENGIFTITQATRRSSQAEREAAGNGPADKTGSDREGQSVVETGNEAPEDEVASEAEVEALLEDETQNVHTSTGHVPQKTSVAVSVSKRKRAAEEEIPTLGSKRARTTSEPSGGHRRMSSKEVQIVRYVNHIMSSNVRSYAVGLLIEGNKMRLVYGDRMGLVFTKAFEFLDKEAPLFLLVLAAMGGAGVHDLGVHPSLIFNQTIDQRDIFHFASGYTLSDALVRLEVQDAQGASHQLEFDIDSDEPDEIRPVDTAFGLIGRGTTIIAVKARRGPALEMCGSEPLVAKVAWPHKARQAEDRMIRTVRQQLAAKKSKYLEHVVDLKCAVTKSIEEMGLPRVAMGIIPEEQDRRVCRTLILKRYQRLEAIGSAEGFHIVFVDVVRAHYWVYETSKILHRDISINNVMWFIKDGQVIGVLCDWDLAEDHSNGDVRSARPAKAMSASWLPWRSTDATTPNSSNEPQSQSNAEQVTGSTTVPPEGDHMKKPRYRTGTGPFMALDLLREGNPPLHKYRHDLESFFYLYAYAAAAYDPTNKAFEHIEQWQHVSLIDIGHSKYRFLTDLREFNNVFGKAHEAFKPLLEPGSFLKQLRLEFADIEYEMDTIKRLVNREASTDLTEQIEKVQQKRDKMMTYKKFMEILGAPEDV
ncbi:uncharacterized protein C8Q71DRAFT_911027 [Rhodofomes roseus]|uniref:Fungal-type protein kinase domain-containing protein n=1 Tax=Rhodofomes roseus TaxID=34475 RepID=A0ABQ8K2T5_9APHY|nr:uncharacterized protein C8Q71DRAFT_911027 [Rhodofomes roseus]KAH9831027.1 hypothetical protein C8Q71DRAFT_911027 [Rhodofomes roseus]